MMKTTILLPAILLLGLSASAIAIAQTAPHAGAGHTMPTGKGKNNDLSTKAYRDAMAKMHKDMNIPYTGDADADFMKAMIPHHQGAIDMAKVALVHGTDPEVRKMAEAVIKAQDAEIATMKAWLAKKGP